MGKGFHGLDSYANNVSIWMQQPANIGRCNEMKTQTVYFLAAVLLLSSPAESRAQFPMSIGPYVQNFDSLANSGTANAWADNSTLAGWYASRAAGGPITNYRSDNGNT